MNPQDPLANLQPLREPPLIHWWPPAPGWWLLAALLLLVVALLVIWYLGYRKRNAYRRSALLQLQALAGDTKADSDDRAFATRLNALLKSTALAAYPATQVAARHGESWRSFLNEPLASNEYFDAAFTEALYSSKAQPVAKEAAIHSARQWIRKHRAAS